MRCGWIAIDKHCVLAVAALCLIALPGLAAGATTAAFDWSMPPRYGLDVAPADGVTDPLVDPAAISPSSWRVDFDACASTGSIIRYRWSIDGVTAGEASRCDGFSYDFPAEGAYSVSLEVEDQEGARNTLNRSVVVQDWLIIALGDSYGSGEGNPDIPIGGAGFDSGAPASSNFESQATPEAAAALRPTWQDRRCHRSARSGQAQAALRIEQADPHTSVTFIHLSCSGGRITAGLLEEDQGIDSPAGAAPIPPQLFTAAALRGRREIDAIILSIGGNDLGFSGILQSCIAADPCNDPPTNLDITVPGAATLICSVAKLGSGSAACFDYFDDLYDPNQNAKQIYDTGIAALPSLYDRLQQEVQRVLPTLPPARLYFTEYPNLTRNERGNLCAFDPLRPLAMLPGIKRDEAAWAEDVVTVGLNNTMAAAAARHGWTYLGELFDRSTPHGYCSKDPWFVQLQETFLIQGDAFGTVHPNANGHAGYADVIGEQLRRDFYIDGDLASPRLPTACPGDCDGNRQVTVDEIILGIGIGLGVEASSSCPEVDTNVDRAVTVDEVLQAVNAALVGC